MGIFFKTYFTLKKVVFFLLDQKSEKFYQPVCKRITVDKKGKKQAQMSDESIADYLGLSQIKQAA